MSIERFEFCPGAKCAKLTINIKGEKPIVLISRAPTLTLEIEGEKTEVFSHGMTAPIEKTFAEEISDVENIAGDWKFNKTSLYTVTCPMPGTYPALRADDVRKEDITDLYWKENQLFCFFDRSDAYPNNVGVCTYKVYFNFGRYKFSDRQGVLYESRPNKILKYKVECDACCKDDEILCDSNHFPGYSCYPIPPVNSKLLKEKNNIARFWR
jgi:hypothetical protein